MYGEMVYMNQPGEFSPVSESAYCGAGSIHTMLMHTNPITKVLSLFRGVSWDDASFYNLQADGGLTVSASRSRGSLKFFQISSKACRSVRFTVPQDAAWLAEAYPPSILPEEEEVTWVGDGIWEVSLDRGANNCTIVLYSKDASPPFVIRPLPSNISEENWFGYNRQAPPLH